jgi:diphthamide synthase (EF-2-diphthine--ammonia ligase)
MGSGTARQSTNWGTGTKISKKTDASLAHSWSGGKDSALALLALRAGLGRNPSALITTVTETYERISMHGVRRELLALQAQELGLPLVEVSIPLGCPNEIYDARMHEAFASERLGQVTEVAFGDLFLEDVRAYREGRLAAAGKRGLFPLWGRDTCTACPRFHLGRLPSRARLRRCAQARPHVRWAKL